MTREEAIAELTVHLEHWKHLKEQRLLPCNECENTINALDMAIEALKEAEMREKFKGANLETDTEVRLAVTDRHKDRVILYDAFGEVEYAPIVRCKDCRYKNAFSDCTNTYGIWDKQVADDDFCSRAESKADNAENPNLMSHEEAWGQIETHDIRTETHECVKETHDSDLISRADAIERIKSRKEWCVKFGHSDFWKRLDYTEHFIKALPSADRPNDAIETKDDAIDHDKEWIIGCIKHDGFIHTHRFDKANQIILDALDDRPSGEWIPYKFQIYSDAVHIATNYKCNKCGYDPVFEHIEELHYCPNCGARMKGVNE